MLRLRNSDRELVEEQLEKINRLNGDGKIEIINVITWPQLEDGSAYDKQDIFLRLMEMRNITPYLDYDELNMYDTSTRVVHEELRKDMGEVKKALPYCTNPYCVFMLQPDENVSPCCGAFGAIANMHSRDVEEIWNGKEYQLLREAMFQYDMLPDYCRNCRSFIRHDYINEYIDVLKTRRNSIMTV